MLHSLLRHNKSLKKLDIHNLFIEAEPNAKNLPRNREMGDKDTAWEKEEEESKSKPTDQKFEKILRAQPLLFMAGLKENGTLERLSISFTKLVMDPKTTDTFPLKANNSLRSLNMRFPSVGTKKNEITA